MNETIWMRRIHKPFVFAALVIALTAGFGYAALLVGALALKIPLGAWWGASVQAHGHAQLFGWLGMFVLGMGLYFLPRLGGTQLRGTGRAPYAFVLLTLGIVTRSLAQPALGLIESAPALANALRVVWLVSALLELSGMIVIASMLVATRRAEPPHSRESPEYPVIPFVYIGLVSLMLSFILNAVGTIFAVADARATMSPLLDSMVIQMMLYGLAIPMAIVFSVRNLPLFLRLSMPPRAELRTLAFVYAFGLVLRLSNTMAGVFGFEQPLLNPIAALGAILQSLIILIFVWRLDLVRRRAPWTVLRTPNTRPDLEHLRKPTRRGYPDAGEFGRFELLIYSAFVWLVVAVGMSLTRSFAVWLTIGSPVPPDAERHALTLGFITLLIFGMATRMLPGFSGKRGVAQPQLVAATFILGNLASALRVLPLFYPANNLSLALLGVSGVVGWLAVACLAANIFRTLQT